MMGLVSRRPWLRPRWGVMASAVINPARALICTLFSSVQKGRGCRLGAFGRANLLTAFGAKLVTARFCACITALSKRIERRNFIFGSSTCFLGRSRVGGFGTGVHGPMSWGGWPCGKSNYGDFCRLPGRFEEGNPVAFR